MGRCHRRHHHCDRKKNECALRGPPPGPAPRHSAGTECQHPPDHEKDGDPPDEYQLRTREDAVGRPVEGPRYDGERSQAERTTHPVPTRQSAMCSAGSVAVHSPNLSGRLSPTRRIQPSPKRGGAPHRSAGPLSGFCRSRRHGPDLVDGDPVGRRTNRVALVVRHRGADAEYRRALGDVHGGRSRRVLELHGSCDVAVRTGRVLTP